MMKKERISVIRNQGFWELGVITGTALGLPAMIIGGQLVTECGAGCALISILIGNLVLWMVGLGILSMSSKQSHAIQNIKAYLGKKTEIVAALILTFAFLFWYIVQIKSVTITIGNFFPNRTPWQIGIFFGLTTALLSIWGINLIKRVCVWGFPLLACFVIYSVMTTNQITSFLGSWNFSLSATFSVILIWFPGMINLPTVFRHSRSRADSVLGLSVMTLIHMFFQAFTVFVLVDSDGKINGLSNSFQLTFFALFAVLAYMCINLVNIYFASAGWETLFPGYRSSKEYGIIGIAGTLAYVLLQIFSSSFQINFPVNFLEAIAGSFLASLGVVLLIDFLIKIVVRHRPRPLEKLWSSVCWFVGCMTALIMQFQDPSDPSMALIMGVCASILAFLVVIFIEETIWSASKLEL